MAPSLKSPRTGGNWSQEPGEQREKRGSRKKAQEQSSSATIETAAEDPPTDTQDDSENNSGQQKRAKGKNRRPNAKSTKKAIETAKPDLASSSHVDDTEDEDEESESQPKRKKQKAHVPNPNRQKPRITRACDQCRRIHYRCTGAQPCVHCIKGQRNCTYDGKYTRGTAPPFWDASQKDQEVLLKDLGWLPNTSPRKAAVLLSSSEGISEHAKEQFQHSQAFPPEGSLFDRTRNSLNHRVLHTQKSSIFRFGDPPCPDSDTSFFVLPPAPEARQMILMFFENVSPTIHCLHLPTVNDWLNEILDSYKGIRAGADGPSKRAVVLMVLASTQSHMSADSSEANADLSFRYFQTAEKELEAETEEIRLPALQARLLQCFYLLSRSRIHQCWSIFGSIINLIFATGLHRKNGTPGNGGVQAEDMILHECQKRVFWVAYVLDRYLSTVLGRPLLIQDEDIDQELPALVNDDNRLTSTSMTMNNHDSSMKATVCQIRLAMIIGHILKKIYPIKAPTPEKRHARVETIEKELQIWLEDAASFVEFDESFLVSHLGIIQSKALKLAYANVEILLYRKFLLDNTQKHTSKLGFGTDLREETMEKVKKCLDAALRTTDMVHELFKNAENFKALWFAHFCGYSAVVILYVFVIKNHSQPQKVWKRYWKAAELCKQQIQLSGETESFAKRCSSVLEDLHMEAIAKMDGSRPGDRSGVIAASQSGSSDNDGILSTHRRSQAQPQQEQAATQGAGRSIVDKIDRWGFSSLMGY